MSRLKLLRQLACDRNIAMQRARHCKAQGLAGVEADVKLARGFNRLLLRELRGYRTYA